MSELIGDRLLRYTDLKSLGIFYSKVHLGRLEKNKKFPKRIPLSTNRVVWRLSEIQEWMEDQIKRRDAKEAADGSTKESGQV